MDEFADDMLDAMGLTPNSPEEDFMDYLTSDKHPKLYNLQYWFKHQLFVYTSLEAENNWFMTKSHGNSRIQVSRRELSCKLIKYYLQMHYLVKFNNERGKVLDLNKVVELISVHQEIKKFIDNPNLTM